MTKTIFWSDIRAILQWHLNNLRIKVEDIFSKLTQLYDEVRETTEAYVCRNIYLT